MSNKITANFGADVSEVEVGVIKAIKSLERLGTTAKQVNDAIAAQAAANNRAMTAASSEVTKGARESASVFEEMFAIEDNIKKNTEATTRAILEKKQAIGQVGAESKKAAGMFGQLADKFKGGRLIESLAGGLGIGSAMQIAQKGAELIAGYWERAAESATKIAEASTRAADAVISRITGNRTNAQQLAVEKQKMDMVEMIALQAELKAGSDSATNADREAAVEARAKAEELRTSIAKRQKQEDQAAASKKKQDEDAQKNASKALTEQINAIDERRAEEKRTDEERLARLDKEIALRKADKAGGLENTLKLKQAEDKRAEVAERIADKKAKLEEEVGDVIAMIADQQKKNDEDAIARAKELADERQKAFSAASAKNKAEFGNKLAGEGYDVGEDGKLRRGKVVISAEDAARTMSTKDRNARLTAESKRDEIRNAGKIGQGGKTKTEEATLLAKIEAYLRPADLST